MCISIVNDDSYVKYDTSKPLEDQIKNSKEVVINYDPKDCFVVDKFIGEMKRLMVTGVSADLKVVVYHNNHIHGVQTKKQVKKLSKDIDLNEVIKLLVTLQHKTDKTLEELSNFCSK